MVNPRQVRDFTKAIGELAKTNAQVLARFRERVRPEQRTASSPTRSLAMLRSGRRAPAKYGFPPPSAAPSVQRPELARVWVNRRSHVYHCPGTRYYGTTKRGTYMAEADALADGNRPAHGRRCSPGAERLLTLQAPSDVAGANAGLRVWVNTSSGVYHCPGSRFCGKTKRGQVMTEAIAKASGYRAAGGNECS